MNGSTGWRADFRQPVRSRRERPIPVASCFVEAPASSTNQLSSRAFFIRAIRFAGLEPFKQQPCANPSNCLTQSDRNAYGLMQMAGAMTLPVGAEIAWSVFERGKLHCNL